MSPFIIIIEFKVSSGNICAYCSVVIAWSGAHAQKESIEGALSSRGIFVRNPIVEDIGCLDPGMEGKAELPFISNVRMVCLGLENHEK